MTHKKKSYEAHEVIYKRMRKEGILTWGQKSRLYKTVVSLRPEIRRFFKDIFSRSWAPKQGRVIEFGCGTAPLLRDICKKGFTGVGIDVSPTAIAMAKEQSKGLDIKFMLGDVCNLDKKKLGLFDIVLDGMCLHCITDMKDRKAYFNNVFKILKDDGVFILLTMSGPLNRKRFIELYADQKIINKVIYLPFDYKGYKGSSTFNGKRYLPTRYMGHWKDILSELSHAGFKPQLIRYEANNREDVCGTLTVGALKK
ncbi:MAG: class I SAM-dependent methyltransferase [Phycisphaerae bacterium]